MNGPSERLIRRLRRRGFWHRLLRFSNNDFTFSSATALTGAGTIEFNLGTYGG